MLREIKTFASSVFSGNVDYVPGLYPVPYYSVKGHWGITPQDTSAHKELVLPLERLKMKESTNLGVNH